jgi:hypothetical protein
MKDNNVLMTERVKYLRNGTDDQIFIMCKEIDWCVEVGEDVESEEERQEVIDGLPTSVYFGKEWLKNKYCDWFEEGEVDVDEFHYSLTNEISDETGWLINDLTHEYKNHETLETLIKEKQND